jgi:hypothetical protein
VVNVISPDRCRRFHKSGFDGGTVDGQATGADRVIERAIFEAGEVVKFAL